MKDDITAKMYTITRLFGTIFDQQVTPGTKIHDDNILTYHQTPAIQKYDINHLYTQTQKPHPFSHLTIHNLICKRWYFFLSMGS